ncbi:MAG: GMC family oxidoreductase [Verrucomicrobia bacterium]|nr:GMC family oxidoreductase [Verrucomicrobiota bacterium]
MKKKTILASLVVGLVTSLSSLMATDKGDQITYDYIIVGNGTAGAVLARKLSDDHKTKVLVLEQGINHEGDEAVLDVSGSDLFNNLTTITFNPKYAETYSINVFFPLVATSYSEGKGWGGSSLHNYLQVVRGTPDIYNQWAAISGNPLWSYNNLLPLMMALENYTPCSSVANPAERGVGGPISITQSDPVTTDPLGMLIAAPGGTNCGFITDINDPTQVSTTGFANLGVSSFQLFATAFSPCTPSQRSYSANEFLPHSVVSFNGKGQNGRLLRIESNAYVSKVLFDGKKAVGVKFVYGNLPNKALKAFGKKIILCAGGVNTPAILQRSGIGDPAVLEPLGIKVRVNNPNVGANLLNQYGVQAICLATTNATPFLQAFINASGLAAPYDYPSGTTRRVQLDAVQAGPGVCQLFGFILEPKSRGSIKIVEKNALTQPLIDLGMYTDGPFTTNGTDANLAVATYQLIAQSVGVGNMIFPSPAQYMAGPAALFQAATTLSGLVAESHICGTARMGTSIENSVVDGELRVRGVKNLYVVDASAIPVLADGNTCYSVYALALGAAKILGVPVPPAR